MPQSLVQIYVHLVWSTKNRAPYLVDRSDRDTLYKYVAGICNKQGSPAIKIGGVEDHIHICCRLGKVDGVSTLIRELKRSSSVFVKESEIRIPNFHWQSGYGAFSISPAHLNALVKYIEDQEEHHKTETYQDEFRRLCQIYGVPIDEKYAWD